ncbi:MAG: EVE domain-containing protein [Planctomycetes bacterium]|nr:EVE domain-containing protein [Planctomycetota bacterium]
MRYWLMKSEPDVFGIADLERKGTSPWDGVRNYQARNNLVAMEVGDQVFIHHSNAKPPGVVGLGRVARAAYPDHTAWDPKSDYFDRKSTPEKPRWMMVDVAFVRTFPRLLSMDELKTIPDLADIVLLNNSRLSVQPVSDVHARIILALAGKGPGKGPEKTRRGKKA